ncbi:MAG: leucyl/phenylalanyl-tRNA--protein transferase [Betaproteobacteria bacterium]
MFSGAFSQRPCNVGRCSVIPRLEGGAPFPPIERALRDPDGLLAAGGDLSVQRLVDAYSRGIFPWFAEGQPVLWWSPDPRMVLFVDEFVMSRSLRRRVNSRVFDITIDTAFDAVIRACSAPRSGQHGTWITDTMVDAYGALHRAGYAHSVEAWREGALVGGLYGIALGGVFFGESMFTREADASKVALAHLVSIVHGQGVPMIDCQQQTSHLASLGARPIARPAFAAQLRELIHSTQPPTGWHAGAAAAIRV